MTRVMMMMVGAAMLLAPMTELHAKSTAGPADELRVMSFNVRVRTFLDFFNGWSSRRDTAVEAIQQFQPDILGTQECLDEQARDLLKRLPGYGFVGAGRKNGKLSGGEMCAIFFRTDRFTLANHGHFWLSEKMDKPGSRGFGSWWPRMVTWVQLRPTAGGDDVFVFNTHLDVSGESVRLAQAALLRQQIQSIAGDQPVIVMGDFNTTETSSTYRRLLGADLGAGAMVDAFRAVHPTAGRHERTHHGFSGKTVGQRIDWIFNSLHFVPTAAAIVRHNDDGDYPSDHFPVTAVLRPVSSVEATVTR